MSSDGRPTRHEIVQALLQNSDVLCWTRKRKTSSKSRALTTTRASALVDVPRQAEHWSRDASADVEPRVETDADEVVRVRSLISDGRAAGDTNKQLDALFPIPSITEAEEAVQQRLVELRTRYIDRVCSSSTEGGTVVLPPDDVLLAAGDAAAPPSHLMPTPSPSSSPPLALPLPSPPLSDTGASPQPSQAREEEAAAPPPPSYELEPNAAAAGAAGAARKASGVVVCPHCRGVSAEMLNFSTPPSTRPPTRIRPDAKLESFLLPGSAIPRRLIDAVIAEVEAETPDDQQVLKGGCGPERVSILGMDYPSCTRTQSSLCEEESSSSKYVHSKSPPHTPASLSFAHTRRLRFSRNSRATRRRCKRRCYGKGEFQVTEYECMRAESKAKFLLARAVFRAAYDGLSAASKVWRACLC